MDNISTIAHLREEFTATKNANIVHRNRMSKLDRAALFVTTRVGTMGFFFACIALVAIPILFNSTISTIQYISSGVLQLILLPLIMVGQNLQGRHAELRAKYDFETNTKAEKEIETILLHLERQDETMLKILNKIEALEKQK